MKAKVVIGDQTKYVTFRNELLEYVLDNVDSFEDHTGQDWYFIFKDFNVVNLADESDVEDLYWK